MYHHKLLLLEITEKTARTAGGMGTVSAGNTGVGWARLLIERRLDQQQENPCRSSETDIDNSSAFSQPSLAAIAVSTPERAIATCRRKSASVIGVPGIRRMRARTRKSWYSTASVR